MKKNNTSRREFIKNNSAVGLGAAATITVPGAYLPVNLTKKSTKPALLGGMPAMEHDWPSWPIWNQDRDEQRLLDVMRSGVWSRNKVVDEFEQRWAEMIGTKRCLAVVNGTNALNAALAMSNIGWGDEVIVTPYTFIASVSSIMFNGAIPIFVDVDPETFQMDPDKIEAQITEHTKAIMAVHILGLPSDMKRIMKIAERHNLIVIEDACQAWLAEIDQQKVGTFGKAGCFSFQNSKNIPIGEGGAIVSDDDDFMDRCHSYHNYGNPFGAMAGEVSSGAVMVGTKLRITEYQAAIGLAQMERLEEQTERRNQQAALLSSLLDQIDGIHPYRLYDDVTRAAFHLYAFRYDKNIFKGLPRAKFLESLHAEGIPCSSGYKPLNKMPYLENAFQSSNFRKFYPEKRLVYSEYAEANHCPISDRLCEEEAVWINQKVLLGSDRDMEKVAGAIEKIFNHAEKLK